MNREEIYSKIEEYISGVVEDAITNVEDQNSAQLIRSMFPEYDIDWCAEDFTRDMEDQRNAIIDRLVEYFMNIYFYYE